MSAKTKLTEYFKSISEKDFIELFFSIVDKKRQEIPFKFNLVQKSIWDNLKKYNVVLKYRKPGVSVFVQCLMLASCLMKKNQNCVVLSYDRESTQRMLERTEWTLAHLPIDFTLERNSRNEFKIKETNSKLYIGTPGSKAFGRGDDITILHLSEIAWFDDTTAVTGLMEALTTDAKVFFESTANGNTNLFAQLVRKSQKATKDSEWAFHFFPWWVESTFVLPVPSDFQHTEEEKELVALYKLTPAQLMWRRRKMDDMLEPELFEQEFPSSVEGAFLVLGDCIFKKRAIANYRKLVSEPVAIGEVLMEGTSPFFQPNPDGNFRLWKHPQLGCQYYVIVDACDPEGMSSQQGNPACIQIIDKKNLEQVAIYHGWTEPVALGKIAFALGLYYNTAEIVVERQSGGISVLDCLRTVGYPNIYKMQDFQYGDLRETEKIGWMTNVLTRPLMLGELKECVSNGFFILHDADTVAELSTFIRNKKTGKMEAAGGCNDDRVITLAIGAYLRSVNPVSDYTSDLSYMDKLRSRWNDGLVEIPEGKGGY